MGRKRQIKKNELLKAIQGSRGFISTIAARLHCEWHTANNAIKLYPECEQALEDENETTLDFIEGKAVERINAGDGAMIRFYLATKGKRRGFVYDSDARQNEEPDEDIKIEIEDAQAQVGK